MIFLWSIHSDPAMKQFLLHLDETLGIFWFNVNRQMKSIRSEAEAD